MFISTVDTAKRWKPYDHKNSQDLEDMYIHKFDTFDH